MDLIHKSPKTLQLYLFKTAVGVGTSLPLDPPFEVEEELDDEGFGVMTFVGVDTCSCVFVFLFINISFILL